MEGKLHPRIIGACVVGFALVAGAYTLSNFGQPRLTAQQAAVTVAEATPRVAIAVTDNDGNGVEDWRDEFITTRPIVVDEALVDYQQPSTITGQAGISLIQNYITSQVYGTFNGNEEQAVTDAVAILAKEADYTLYDTPDITIMPTWEDQDIRVYANSAALALTNNNVDAAEGELAVLQRALEGSAADPADIAKLRELADAYKAMRDQTLSIPVPGILAKQHLDLINTYHAIHKDIEAMTLSTTDPILTLMRLKRYEDDATGLRYALENMYEGLEPYASLVQPDDPALLFVIFSPEFTS